MVGVRCAAGASTVSPASGLRVHAALVAPRSIVDVLNSRWALPILILVVAFAARLGMVYAHGGSLHGSSAYDTGVYYAAGDALIHGRLPYRDFTLVHPPVVMLAAAPFAALGRLTTDHIGFMVATVSWMALGAVNALLVLLIGRRMHIGTAASAIGAFGYAVWYESTRAEFSLKLEPLGNFFVLLGIFAVLGPRRRNRRLALVGGGAALGTAASVKIWYVVPLLIVLGFGLIDRDRRREFGWAGAGACVAVVAINGPFFALAPGQMWQMVVTDQLGRQRSSGLSVRLAEITSSGLVGPASTATAVHVTAAVGAAVLVGLGVLAWRTRPGRFVTTLAAVQLVVVELAPNFFRYYSDYLAPAFALTVAAASAALLGSRAAARSPGHRRATGLVAGLPLVAVAGLALAIDLFHPTVTMTRAPAPSLQRAIASARCVQSDSPMALIQLDVLSRDLVHHCPVWVDVIGRSYAAPLKPTGRIHGTAVGRRTYLPWQRALLRYLRSGNTVVVVDPRAAGISRQTLREITRGPVIERAGGYVVHRT